MFVFNDDSSSVVNSLVVESAPYGNGVNYYTNLSTDFYDEFSNNFTYMT